MAPLAHFSPVCMIGLLVLLHHATATTIFRYKEDASDFDIALDGATLVMHSVGSTEKYREVRWTFISIEITTPTGKTQHEVLGASVNCTLTATSDPCVIDDAPKTIWLSATGLPSRLEIAIAPLPDDKRILYSDVQHVHPRHFVEMNFYLPGTATSTAVALVSRLQWKSPQTSNEVLFDTAVDVNPSRDLHKDPKKGTHILQRASGSVAEFRSNLYVNTMILFPTHALSSSGTALPAFIEFSRFSDGLGGDLSMRVDNAGIRSHYAVDLSVKKGTLDGYDGDFTWLHLFIICIVLFSCILYIICCILIYFLAPKVCGKKKHIILDEADTAHQDPEQDFSSRQHTITFTGSPPRGQQVPPPSDSASGIGGPDFPPAYAANQFASQGGADATGDSFPPPVPLPDSNR